MPLTAAGAEAGSNTPLFTVSEMAPGQRFERCIVIIADAAGSAVRLSVSGVSGALAPWLKVEGSTGTGASRGCRDFVAGGAAFYTGNLAALASEGTEGVATGWIPGGPQRRTFRLAVEVADDARAAGAQAIATLVWRLQGSYVPSTAPVTTTPVGPGDGPGGSAPANTPRATPSILARSSSATAPAATSSRRDTTSSAALPKGTGVGGAARPEASALIALPCPPSTATRMADLMFGVARNSVLPLLLLLLVLLFLALQDRFDRKDPKLAEAPLYGEPDQAFPETGTTPWRTQ